MTDETKKLFAQWQKAATDAQKATDAWCDFVEESERAVHFRNADIDQALDSYRKLLEEAETARAELARETAKAHRIHREKCTLRDELSVKWLTALGEESVTP